MDEVAPQGIKLSKQSNKPSEHICKDDTRGLPKAEMTEFPKPKGAKGQNATKSEVVRGEITLTKDPKE